MMKKMGYKPRRRKGSHQWWESPWIDYDTPREKYYQGGTHKVFPYYMMINK